MKLVPVLVLASVLAGCATPPQSSSVYNYYQTQNEQFVRTGTVESIRNVSIVNPERGVGTVGGAALGGLAGSNIGGGKGEAAGAIVGALAGGLLGQRIEQSANTKQGIEITVRLDTGELVAITQTADEQFRPGERVRLLSNGTTTRVSH
ncbi:glycine zipper 2TM domain-containing protein [Massilia solisilvae]|uniref:Glycine zipper 2TM domain-containing protein n=1 Tax=Massilia solisilvae TaxID=1811225 RepID=A0ABT2BLN5_9BURK|nr:glycine zipper 2TM domain-containing protein [Massilia solisilvae]MCS0609416.1 glycine zipper 2TM domain-containing protein [Massilia solisilvae]